MPREDGGHVNVLIDPGKFFYHSAIEWFPKFGIRALDAIVLTHAHYDAAGGLDDLRDWTNNAQQTIPMYVRDEDMQILSKIFYYLVDRSKVTSGGTVAKLQFSQITSEPFRAAGLEMTPLPVWHGRPYTAQGYKFGEVCYLPDVSEIPDETARLVEGCGLLVIDALRPERTHGSHFTVGQAADVARQLKPRRTLLVGMCHDVDHETTSKWLASLRRSEGLCIELAHDGLSTEFEL
jgi:phosphoribosyl 1,2-cyclic phosphodiesterase